MGVVERPLRSAVPDDEVEREPPPVGRQNDCRTPSAHPREIAGAIEPAREHPNRRPLHKRRAHRPISLGPEAEEQPGLLARAALQSRLRRDVSHTRLEGRALGPRPRGRSSFTHHLQPRVVCRFGARCHARATTSSKNPSIKRTYTIPAIGVAVAIVVAVVTLLSHDLFHSSPRRVATGAWIAYMGGIQRTGFNPRETTITPQHVSPLEERWVVPGKATISAGATLAAGRLYWGSWDGYEHASDAVTGKEVWRTFLGQVTDKGCYPQHAGVTSTAAVGFVHLGASRVRALFVGGGDGSIYALRAATGKIIWKHNFGSPRKGWFIWSSFCAPLRQRLRRRRLAR